MTTRTGARLLLIVWLALFALLFLPWTDLQAVIAAFLLAAGARSRTVGAYAGSRLAAAWPGDRRCPSTMS